MASPTLAADAVTADIIEITDTRGQSLEREPCLLGRDAAAKTSVRLGQEFLPYLDLDSLGSIPDLRKIITMLYEALQLVRMASSKSYQRPLQSVPHQPFATVILVRQKFLWHTSSRWQ
jgi:hypothetical protein